MNDTADPRVAARAAALSRYQSAQRRLAEARACWRPGCSQELLTLIECYRQEIEDAAAALVALGAKGQP